MPHRFNRLNTAPSLKGPAIVMQQKLFTNTVNSFGYLLTIACYQGSLTPARNDRFSLEDQSSFCRKSAEESYR